MRERIGPRSLLPALAAALLLTTHARAAGPTFVVNSTADLPDNFFGDGQCMTELGVCTLRAAVDEANTTTGALIQVPAGEYSLTIGLIIGSKSMTIVGAGAGKTVLKSNPTSRPFFFSSPTPITVVLQGMTLRDGNKEFGGCLRAGDGATLNVIACELTACTGGEGGGLFVNAAGAANLTDTTISGNHSLTAGGGVSAHGALTLRSCTISGNTAATDGGGVEQTEGVGDIVDSTLSGNSASRYGGGVHVGAAGSVGVFNATVADNTGSTQGGGIASDAPAAASLTLRNSVVGGNKRDDGGSPVADDCAGLVLSQGANILSSVDTGRCTVTGSYSAQPATLGPLGANGGPTKTHALLTGSPAIDAGPDLGCTDRANAVLAADQRGVKRPIGAKCDLGAYERSPCGDANGDGTFDVADVFFTINFLFAAGPVPRGLANVNQDGATDVLDVFVMINALFAGGASPVCAGA